jgi:TatD DNase family protein
MKYFDTHAHLNYSPLLDKEKEIVQECADALLLINDVGTCANSSYVAVEQAKKYENVYATVGIHPCDVVEAASNDMERIEELLKDKQQNKIIAIGETGLDYYHKPFDAEVQKAFLLKHIALAIKYDLPLVMHIRDAHDDAYEILTKNIPHNINVIIHCFDSTPEFAKKYTDAGY